MRDPLAGILDLRAAHSIDFGSHMVEHGAVPQKNGGAFPKEVSADVCNNDWPEHMFSASVGMVGLRRREKGRGKATGEEVNWILFDIFQQTHVQD